MKFNFESEAEVVRATNYLVKLVDSKSLAEIKKISPNRTLSQNSYLHLILAAFGVHFGYTLEEAKQIYKEISPTIYKYKKKKRTFWRSSADLSKEDMAKTIDNFMQKSKEAGYPLPLATDQGWLREIENEIERSRYYL